MVKSLVKSLGRSKTMRKSLLRMTMALLCVIALSASACPALAAPVNVEHMSFADYAMVSGATALNLREGPGTEYAVLGSAAEGAWVGIRGESGSWYYVCVLSTGLFGYMSKNYLRVGESASPTPASSGVVSNPKSTSFLNLRQYPSYDAPVLGIYYNGATFTLLSATSDGWYQVQMSSQTGTPGQTGYFRKEYVTLTGGGSGSGEVRYVRASNGGKVNLRNAPTYNGSTVIKKLSTGTPVPVLLSSKAKGSFWKVNCGGVVGYIDSNFLSTTGGGGGGGEGGGESVGPAPVTKGTAVVNNPKASQYLNLREQPSTTANVIAKYKNGVTFQVIEAGETWTKVYGASTGNIGYFMTKYLKLNGVSSTPTKTVENGKSYVNLRSEPSKTTGCVYAQVPSGATVTVLTPGDDWTQVRYKGTVGYMMTYFLK